MVLFKEHVNGYIEIDMKEEEDIVLLCRELMYIN
jgi:hypothetical protein